MVTTAEDVVDDDAVVLVVEATVVEAFVVVVLCTLLEVAVEPADAEEVLALPLPLGTIALLVAVAVLSLCATELGKPLYSVGPGMV